MPATIAPNLAWLLLLIAGLLEIVWSVSMKASHGFTRHYFTALTLVAAALSFWLLGLALRSCQSVPHTLSGRALALLEPLSSASCSSVSRCPSHASGASRSSCVAFSASSCWAAKVRPDPSAQPTRRQAMVSRQWRGIREAIRSGSLCFAPED